MTPNDTTAMRLYHAQCDIWNAITAPTWGDLPEHRKVMWRQYAELVTALFNIEAPPRRTARTVAVQREGEAS